FTVSSLAFIGGALLAGLLAGHTAANYLLMAGLGLLAIGSAIIPLTSSFLLLLFTGVLRNCGMAFIDANLNTVATESFQETLGENLNAIHGMYGVGALAGPVLLALGILISGNLVPAYWLGVAIAIIAILLIFGQRTSRAPKPAVSPQQPEKESI